MDTLTIGTSSHNEPTTLNINDLTTHAVILGMTGSGKTGLGIVMLEEIAKAGVPVFVLDVKGDMTNIPLVFNSDDNRLKLSETGIEISNNSYCTDEYYKIPKRIYTPGSSINPVNILSSLSMPDGWQENKEELREMILFVSSSLLSLAGFNSATSSVEHVYISKIIEWHWDRGYNLTLPQLVKMANDPPFSKIGVLPNNDAFPPKTKNKLIRALNAISSNSSFELWTKGDPLDFSNNGINIYYLAHLPEFEKNFFISMFYNELYLWMKKQEGVSDLKLVTYLDECVGMLPPYPKNPPTKEIMLKLLKQGRAFGVGLILATQNPKDLDYKSISNIGTWFIGTLQTTHDRSRVYEGMQVDKSLYDSKIKELNSREFIMHTDGGDIQFTSRNAYANMIGPITKKQIADIHKYLSTITFKPPVRLGNYYLPVNISPSEADVKDFDLLYVPILYAETTFGSFVCDVRDNKYKTQVTLGKAISNASYMEMKSDGETFLKNLQELSKDKVYYVNNKLKMRSNEDETLLEFTDRVNSFCITCAKEEIESEYEKWKIEHDLLSERLEDITRMLKQTEQSDADDEMTIAIKTSYMLSYQNLKEKLESMIGDNVINDIIDDITERWKEIGNDIIYKKATVMNKIYKFGTLWVPYYKTQKGTVIAWRDK